MKISVLLDNYNYGRFIGAAIESVLGQTYRDFELIIVDDGSTDNSREIIARYSDPRIITVFKPNGGQASAFKAGFAKASGEYIAFLDSDDVWDPDKLEKCVQILLSQPDITLFNHGYRSVDGNGGEISKPSRFRKSGVYDFLSELRALDVRFSLVPTSFFVGQRKQCLELEFNDNEWRVGADTPIIVGLGMRGRIFNLDETLGSYRVHGANLWHGQYDHHVLFQHYKKIYKIANEEHQRMGVKEQFTFLDSDYAIDHQILENARYTPKGLYYRILKQLRKNFSHGAATKHIEV